MRSYLENKRFDRSMRRKKAPAVIPVPCAGCQRYLCDEREIMHRSAVFAYGRGESAPVCAERVAGYWERI